MRIVYVTNRLPFGQGETFIVPEIEALLAAGHDVLIVPRRSGDPLVHDDARRLVIHTRPVPGVLTLVAAVLGAFARHPRRTARAFRRLSPTRPRYRILVNALATAEGVWLARAARAWGADHIHAHWAHATATLAMGASAMSGIPWSFTAHRYDIVLNNLLAEKLRSARFGRFIARATLDLARQLVGPDAIAGACVLHMGVPLPSTSDDARPARATPVVLCPARLMPVKGHRHLLDAAARLVADGVAFEVWLAGDGPDAAALARRIHQLGLGDRVRMLGMVSHAELLRFYREGKVDCVVLPSVDLGGGVHEGISVGLMEAMAHGVPVVSTRTGGLPELLEGGAGLLVPPADAEALAGALAGVLDSATLRAELGRAGRRRIAEQFDIAKITRDLARRFAGETASGHGQAPLASAALEARR
jgi:colanic acid/amylovoran biosynthesis glycosyltransferase